MNRLSYSLPAGSRLSTLDVVIAAWVLLWLVLGVRVGMEVNGLKELSQRVTTTGTAVEAAGRALGSLGELPVVGAGLGESARQIQEAGQTAAGGGRSSRATIEALSWLLGLAVAAVPTLPVLGLYLPTRLARRREDRLMRGLMDRYGADPELQRFLARRARATMPLERLLREAPEPWRADDAGLARAELRRHGLR